MALHEAEPFALIAAGRLGRDAYARLLQVLSGFHGSLAPTIEAAAAALDSPELSVAAERRRALLDADLIALNATRAERRTVAPQGSAWSVGCLYTVLGSTLGGRVIHRQLDYLFAGDDGRRFFAGAPGDGARWRGFCAALDEYGAQTHNVAAMAAGATFAFAHFAACLREYR